MPQSRNTQLMIADVCICCFLCVRSTCKNVVRVPNHKTNSQTKNKGEHSMATYAMLQSLQQVKATGTTLITLLIGPKADLGALSSMLTKEQSAAVNIKSKETRSEVQSALSKLQRTLRDIGLSRSPASGMAMYSGYYVPHQRV